MVHVIHSSLLFSVVENYFRFLSSPSTHSSSCSVERTITAFPFVGMYDASVSLVPRKCEDRRPCYCWVSFLEVFLACFVGVFQEWLCVAEANLLQVRCLWKVVTDNISSSIQPCPCSFSDHSSSQANLPLSSRLSSFQRIWCNRVTVPPYFQAIFCWFAWHVLSERAPAPKGKKLLIHCHVITRNVAFWQSGNKHLPTVTKSC